MWLSEEPSNLVELWLVSNLVELWLVIGKLSRNVDAAVEMYLATQERAVSEKLRAGRFL